MTEKGANKQQRSRVMEEELAAQLRKALQTLRHSIPIFLFVREGFNDAYNDVAREIVQAFSQLSDKIESKEYGLDHKLAEKWEVLYTPTILFDPDRYSIRWLGAPAGEEGRTFLEALFLLGNRDSMLSDQSRKIMEKIDGPRHVKVFVSPTCPYCPQQAVNAFKAAVHNPKLISLELIDIQANPDLADRYNAHSVPQTWANETLIAMGAQPEELFLASLLKMEEQTIYIPEDDAEVVEADLVIIGGGPAGLTAAIYGVRSGVKSVLVERGILGGQITTTPIVENYPGFSQVGGRTLVDIMVAHALEYAKIFQGEEVMEIQPGAPMIVLTNRRKFVTKTVLLATGATYRRLNVPGENRFSGRGVSYCSTCDGPLFKDKKVIIVGGGNSAVTEALHMKNIGVEVTLVHRRDTLRAQEHLIENLAANNIPILWNMEVKEIRGNQKVTDVLLYNNKTDKTSSLAVEGVFVAVGYDPEVRLAKQVGIELTPEGYIKHDSRHRTNVPGVYSAGDVEGGFKQIVTAAGQGAEAALSIFEDLIHPYWLEKDSAAAPGS
ncbi:MAG: thioredoxin-disulfide reductase [Deltaproteobacteria bacterium]|nr:thioredoxin-disulfide reductase [Deltaproteobacteria bacterium]